MAARRGVIDYDRKRRAEQPWRAWYKTARWQLMRRTQLSAHPLCQCPACGEGKKRITPATVVDHVKPHRGNEALFWDPRNLESWSKGCHDSLKQAQEKGGRMPGCDADGLPIDPRHPWSRAG